MSPKTRHIFQRLIRWWNLAVVGCAFAVVHVGGFALLMGLADVSSLSQRLPDIEERLPYVVASVPLLVCFVLVSAIRRWRGVWIGFAVGLISIIPWLAWGVPGLQAFHIAVFLVTCPVLGWLTEFVRVLTTPVEMNSSDVKSTVASTRSLKLEVKSLLSQISVFLVTGFACAYVSGKLLKVPILASTMKLTGVPMLYYCGPEALPALKYFIEHSDNPKLRSDAVQRLGDFHPTAETKPLLVYALADNDESIRTPAAFYLVRDQTFLDDAVAVEALLNWLLRDKSRGRPYVIYILSNSFRSPKITEALYDCLDDNSLYVRLSAAEGLLRLGEFKMEACDVIGNMFDSDNADAHRVATRSLRDLHLARDNIFRSRSGVIVPILLDVLNKEDNYYECEEVIEILSDFGPYAKSALPILRKVEDPDLREPAKEAIRKIEQEIAELEAAAPSRPQ